MFAFYSEFPQFGFQMNDPFKTGAYNHILADVMASRTGSRVGSASLSAEVTATVRGHVVVKQTRVPITIKHDGHNTASVEFDWATAGVNYPSLGLFASMDTRFQQFVVSGFDSLQISGPDYTLILRIES